MSGSGITFYDEQLKYLLRLFKALLHTIVIGETHNFIGYVPDPQDVKDTGCAKAVVSHTLENSFGACKMPGPAGAKTIIASDPAESPWKKSLRCFAITSLSRQLS
ncbi:hypothetical protein C8J57DRAFT_1244411 [Mycena rebaudengoi]|nr:hypothetical protein C8J57DRAFT_1244411 [Mycena rebaudengoi]